MISDQGHPRRPVVLCILDAVYRTDVATTQSRPQTRPTSNGCGCRAARLYRDVRCRRWPSCRPDGKLRSRPHEPGGRTDRQPGYSAHRFGYRDGLLSGNTALNDFIAALTESGGTAHLLGLLSPGGVHSHQDQLLELARILTCSGIAVAVHAFLDGRDTPPSSAREFIASFDAALSKLPGASIASVCGRFFAMDRDERWDRVKKAYDLIVSGKGAPSPDALTAVEDSYAKDVTDEFVEPAIIGGYAGMSDGDEVRWVISAPIARKSCWPCSTPGSKGSNGNRLPIAPRRWA